jgi:hypothetical protein
MHQVVEPQPTGGRLLQQRMPRTGNADELLAQQQPVVDQVAVGPQAGQDEVRLAGGEHRPACRRRRESRSIATAGAASRMAAERWRHQRTDAMVAGGDAKAPDQAARLEARRQQASGRPRSAIAGAGSIISSARLVGSMPLRVRHEQRIAEQAAELASERLIAGWLMPDPLRGLGHASRLQEAPRDGPVD